MAEPKVSIFLQNLYGGGAERMMLNLAGGIRARGIPVDLVLVRATGPLLDAVPEGVRTVELGAARTMSSVPHLARYLRRERPAALLAALTHVNIVAIIAGIMAGRPSRIVVSERNTISEESAERPTLMVRAARNLVPFLYPRADRIIAVSRGAAEDLARYGRIPIERIDVVNNPTVTPETRRLAAAPLDHPWFAPSEPPVILGVGRLSIAKDFGTLIRAFAKLRQQRRARLMILGEGRLRGELEALVAELGLGADVALPGYTRNPYAFMARAAVLALTSRWEGSPNVLVEAMSCGTPVVATDCPSGPVDILENGRLGRLVPIGDHGALADAIAATLDAPPPAHELRRKADAFSVDSAAEGYLEVMLGRRPAPASASSSGPSR